MTNIPGQGFYIPDTEGGLVNQDELSKRSTQPMFQPHLLNLLN